MLVQPVRRRVEDAIYDSYAMRKFMGINFFEQDVPDATTLLKFRHLLEEKGIGKLFFEAINRCLERAGRMMRGGTIVDATLISAPSSTKNAEKKRDPEMHQTKKGNQWHFGMKCHTGVDAGSGFVHTAVLYVVENGCKWRSLPKEYGDWHVIYVRINRWAKNGVLQAAFLRLQQLGIIQIQVNVVSLDSTCIKVHPDGMGALKKVAPNPLEEHGADGTPNFIWSPHLIEMG